MGYSILSLSDILEIEGEYFLREILSNFSCINKDVQKFLTGKSAIDFAKQGITQTFLVYTSYKGKNVLCGYFSLANKYIIVNRNAVSKTLAKRLKKFTIQTEEKSNYIISMPLIAQLGKNYTNGYNQLISGDELLKMALDKIKEAQIILGGKFVYLECEDIIKLREFYQSNGFVEFGRRKLDPDEQFDMEGTELIQLLKYIK